MFNLPIEDGASAELCAEEGRGRIVVECSRAKDSPRWSLRFEVDERYEDGDGSELVEWIPGIPISMWISAWVDLLLPLRDLSNATVASLVRAVTSGSKKMPVHKKVRVAKSRGWWVDLECIGDLQSGEPIVVIEFKRPLAAEEMVAFLGQMALAFDAWRSEGYDFLD
jgi:hypothetical protein